MHLVYLTNEEKKKITDDITKNTNGLAKATEDISNLSNDINTKAGAIKEKASGENIVVTDSDEQKPLGLAIDGKSEQTQYSGKNHFNIGKTVTSTENITTYTKDDNSITITTESELTDGYGRVLIDAPVDSSKTYTISFDVDSTCKILVGWMGCTKIIDSSGEKHYSATFNGITTQSLSIASRDVNTTVKFSNIQIEEGNVSTDYEPYCGGKPSPNPSYPQEIRNIGVYDEASGKYAVEVKCTKKNLINQSCVPGGKGSKYWLKSGIYTVSRDLSEIAIGNTWYLKAIDKNNNFITERAFVLSGYNPTAYNLSGSGEWYFGGDGRISCTFELKEDCFVIFGSLNGSGNTYLQLEYGTIATHIEPYEETTATVLLDEPLRKGDKAYWNGGSKIRVDRYRKRANLRNLKAVQVTPYDATKTNRFSFNLLETNNAPNDVCCNIAKGVESGSFVNTCRIYDASTLFLFLDMETFPDATSFTEYVAQNDVFVEYTLATPITEEIDIDLGELSMFYPTTIISNDCNANMEVEYVVDTKTYIGNLEAKHEADIQSLKTAIIALGGTI